MTMTITHFLCWWTDSLWKSLEVPPSQSQGSRLCGKRGHWAPAEIVGRKIFGLLVYWADYNAFTWIEQASLKWMWDFSSQKTSALYSSKALDSSSYTFQCQSHGIISSKWKTSKTISSIRRDKIQKNKQLRGIKKTVNLQGVLSKPSKLAAFWRFVKSQYVSEFRREKRNAPPRNFPQPNNFPAGRLGIQKTGENDTLRLRFQ